MTHAIVSDDYREEQKTLREDKIIQQMAWELRDGLAQGHVKLDEFSHPPQGNEKFGTPRHEFMSIATRQYASRCKAAGVDTKHRTIGAVATAVLYIATED